MADPQNTTGTPADKTSGADATPHNPGLTPKPGDPSGTGASGGAGTGGAGAGGAGQSGGLPSDVEPDPSQQPG